MKKSLIVIASALLLTVAAASTNRLRYDSSVFADSGGPAGGYRAQATRIDYPPCIKGVREDSCIQLYERGVRRNYQRWLEAHGRSDTRYASARNYPVCRNRRDDECRQGNGVIRFRTGYGQQARGSGMRASQRFAARPLGSKPPAARPMLQRTSTPRPRGGVSTPGI